MVPLEPATIAVRNILTRLCKRSGLSADRLRTTEIDASHLLDLPAVRQYALSRGIDPVEAVLPVVRELARQLTPTNRIIVDAELTLGLLREQPGAEVDFEQLYAADLGERREYLTAHWRVLHELLAAEHIPPAPTVRSLRATPERRAFTALASLLASDPAYPGRAVEAATTPVHSPLARGMVTVIGDAAIDHIFRVDQLPGPGASAWANGFSRHPGGKGLNRAIAAARLGLQVRLICAVGEDDGGSAILRHLRRERVDSSLVQRIPDTPTPVSAMMITGTGSVASLRYMESRIRLDPRNRSFGDAIAASDVVLLTFGGQPVEVLEQIIDTIRTLPHPPLLVVHPAPPLARPQYLFRLFSAIDYLVGTQAELAQLLVTDVPADPHARAATHSTPAALDTKIAPQLRALGVATVCAVDGFACRVRSQDLELDISQSTAVTLEDSPGAQVAFAAALIYRLVTTGRTADRRDFEWATAAMAATQSFGDVPTAMPTLGDINRIANLAARRPTDPTRRAADRR